MNLPVGFINDWKLNAITSFLPILLIKHCSPMLNFLPMTAGSLKGTKVVGITGDIFSFIKIVKETHNGAAFIYILTCDGHYPTCFGQPLYWD